jgi:hypothetical protein
LAPRGTSSKVDEETLVASNARKQGGGRTTPKGTRPPAKKAGAAAPKAGAPAGKGAAPELPVNEGPNRQMRRAGHTIDAPEQNTSRMRMILIAIGAALALSTLALIFFLGLNGTWIGLLGLAAGIATGMAVSTGRTWFADKGRWVAIALVAIGVVVAGLGTSGVVAIDWSIVALAGCGIGAMFAEISSQQMTPPDGPPASAVALLRRMGAQKLDAPTAGGTVWATPDGRIRVIIGATLAKGSTPDKVTTDRNVRRQRQRGDLVLRRMAALNVEKGLICVVDEGVPTTQDGNDLICSPAGLSRALSR